ncbi:unnamed protein product, partial [Polarella glacialis]
PVLSSSPAQPVQDRREERTWARAQEHPAPGEGMGRHQRSDREVLQKAVSRESCV